MAAPTEHIQARYVSNWLRENRRYEDGRRTAIVLCNEGLLPTVIHCLPDEVEKVNVTTGYPLWQTPVASFIQRYYDLVVGGRSARLLRAFHRHPYARFVSDDGAPLLQMLKEIARQGGAESDDPLFQESLFRAYTLVNRLDGLIVSGDLVVSDQTLQRLTVQLMQQSSIPLPKGVNDSSFIPHSIRQAYQLTTVENKVSIYAYYFHRLLQRAGDVTVLYNNSTEDGQRGEMSRFMLQMMVESGHRITQHTLQAGKQTERWLPVAVSKTERVMSLMNSGLQTLSPSAINRYLLPTSSTTSCPAA